MSLVTRVFAYFFMWKKQKQKKEKKMLLGKCK